MTTPTWPTVTTPAHAALSTAAEAGSTLSKVWTKMVTTVMSIHTTPAPAALPSTTEAWTGLPPSVVTQAVTKAAETGATLSNALTEMVTTGMGIHTTPAPVTASLPPTTTEAWTRSPLPLVTEAVTKVADTGATLSEALTEMVTEAMGIPTTPAPAALSTAADTGATLSEALTEMVTTGMGIPTTPAPAALSTAADTGATLSEALTEMVTTGMGIPTTPAPAALSTAADTGATLSEALTEMVTTGMGIPTTPAPAALSTAADTGATLSEALTELVTEAMSIPPTPAPAPAALPPATEVWTRLPLVTEAVTKGNDWDDGAFAAMIAGIVCIAMLVICIIVLLLWLLSRHKGSYVTKEMDDDDMDDEESVGSDTAF